MNVSEDVCDGSHPRIWAESSNTLGDLLNEEGPDEIPNEFDEHIGEHVRDDGAVPSLCKEGKARFCAGAKFSLLFTSMFLG